MTIHSPLNDETAGPALQVVNLEKRFTGVLALIGVDLEIDMGQTVGLLGPNGSGKTTLVNCVSGVLSPDAGIVLLQGHDITNVPRHKKVQAGLVRTYQNMRLFETLTAAENVEIGLSGHKGLTPDWRRRLVLDALAQQGLERLARNIVTEISYGEQRGVELARAIVARPKVLLLDEPGAGLGEHEKRLLVNSINRIKTDTECAVLIIDHDVSLVMELSDIVVVLAEGRIISKGPPEAISDDPEVIQLYLGTKGLRNSDPDKEGRNGIWS